VSGDTCQCGFGEEYFTIENDESICTVCGGKVTGSSGVVLEEAHRQSGKRILLVDDQPFFRKRIQEALQEKGHTVLEAGEGLEAVRILSGALTGAVQDPARPVSLVILDLTMPGLIDGFQTLGVLKAMDEALPVIILTAIPPTRELLQKLGRLKAKKYVNKASKGLEALLLKNLESL
jgi:CheY-like chemotaxis protein